MNARLQRRCSALGLAILLVSGCAGTPADKAADAGQQSAMARADPGIRVESLRLTAADYLLDLRYRVTDPERAAAFFNRKTELQLIDPVSGARLAVPNTPKLGRLRQVARGDRTNRSYFMLFANPGRYIKPGARLTLAVGDARLENILVEGGGGHHEQKHQL